MPITVDWDDAEQSTLHSTFVGQWTWQEYNQISNKTAEMTKGRTRVVHAIADFSQSNLLPKQALSGFKKSVETSPMNVGIMVLVSNGTLLTTMIDIFGRLLKKPGQQIFAAKTVEEAREIIAKHA